MKDEEEIKDRLEILIDQHKWAVRKYAQMPSVNNLRGIQELLAKIKELNWILEGAEDDGRDNKANS